MTRSLLLLKVFRQRKINNAMGYFIGNIALVSTNRI